MSTRRQVRTQPAERFGRWVAAEEELVVVVEVADVYVAYERSWAAL